MKVMHIFIKILVSCAILVFADDSFSLKAGILLKSITDEVGQLADLKTNVDNQVNDLKPIDFGIAGRYRIKQLQEDIDAKKGKAGIENCTAAFNASLKSVQDGYQNLVKTKLTEQQENLNQKIARLKFIQGRLTGPALTQEIGECQNRNSDKQCNLMGNYSSTEFETSTYIRDHTEELSSPQLVQKYTAQYINAPMLEKDEPKILEPVNKCLAAVK